MDGHGVMDQRLNAAIGQVTCEFAATLRQDDVKVVHMGRRLCGLGQDPDARIADAVLVTLGNGPATKREAFEPVQTDGQ